MLLDLELQKNRILQVQGQILLPEQPENQTISTQRQPAKQDQPLLEVRSDLENRRETLLNPSSISQILAPRFQQEHAQQRSSLGPLLTDHLQLTSPEFEEEL